MAGATGAFSLRSALLFAPGSFACSLGVWQVQRLEEKRAEMSYREGLLNSPPLDLNRHYRANDGAVREMPPRRTPVSRNGPFLHERSIFVGPRVRSELGQAFQGCMIVTPLELDVGDEGRDGSLGGAARGISLFGRGGSRQTEKESGGRQRKKREVLVLRGWVPQGWKDDPSQFDFESLRPQSPVQVQGLVKWSDKPGYFAPANIPEQGQWFYYDVPAMVSSPTGTAHGHDTTSNAKESKRGARKSRRPKKGARERSRVRFPLAPATSCLPRSTAQESLPSNC